MPGTKALGTLTVLVAFTVASAPTLDIPTVPMRISVVEIALSLERYSPVVVEVLVLRFPAFLVIEVKLNDEPRLIVMTDPLPEVPIKSTPLTFFTVTLVVADATAPLLSVTDS